MMFLALRKSDEVIAPKRIAESLGLSPTYLSKITRSLVKADLLRAKHGSKGGVRISRDPKKIYLREIIEACQGRIQGSFCEDTPNPSLACAFHQAMSEVYRATMEVLSHWTLADLIEKPRPSKALEKKVDCWMSSAITR